MLCEWHHRFLPRLSGPSGLWQALLNENLYVFAWGLRWVKVAKNNGLCYTGVMRVRRKCCFTDETIRKEKVCLYRDRFRKKQKRN